VIRRLLFLNLRKDAIIEKNILLRSERIKEETPCVKNILAEKNQATGSHPCEAGRSFFTQNLKIIHKVYYEHFCDDFIKADKQTTASRRVS
jgi:hypothetical protein